jgi:hypothetical protein
MDAVTWSIGCIMAVTLRGQKLYSDEVIVRNKYAVSSMRRSSSFLAATMIFLSLSGNPELRRKCLWNQFQKISLSIHAFCL